MISNKRLIICVTGPMAAGKNLASDILEAKGFATIDADNLVHCAVENSKENILKEFGQEAQKMNINLTDPNGKIDRRALGKLIFSSSELVKRQEQIVYPEVNHLFENFLEENKELDVAINATVLYKVPLINRIDHILYIDAPVIQRLVRAKKRDKIPSIQIIQRFIQQFNLFAKYKKCNADIVRVWNTGKKLSLEKKIDKFLTKCR